MVDEISDREYLIVQISDYLFVFGVKVSNGIDDLS